MKKIIFLTLFMVLVLAGCSAQNKGTVTLSSEEARVKVEEYINAELSEGVNGKILVEDAVEQNGVYKLNIKVPGSDELVVSYMSLDGEIFFFQGAEIKISDNASAETQAQPNPKQPEPSLTKNSKPKVELFVMSHCPYGTQIEKGILPAVEALGDSIDFELKFCDYAMHDEKELDEQLNQYCIQKEEPAKFNEYLTCFLETGVTSGCKVKAKIDESKNIACVEKTDKQFKVKELFADKSTWKSGTYPQFNVYGDDNTKYNVGGSPTLIINGSQVQSSRDSGNLLIAMCAGFEQKPEACSTELSFVNPSPGFGYNTGNAASADASCN